MNIGYTIKKLRRDRGITQEKLAEYLNISPQAVSRWENGTSYPDILIIPAIADFFAVSSDYLFGIEVDKREEDVQAILEQYNQLSASGQKDKRFDLIKAAAAKHPGEFRILIRYANDLLASPYDGITGKTNMAQDKIHKIHSDVIEICERILEDCTIDDVRYDALNTLSLTYMMENDFKNAEKYARMLPDWWESSNMTLYRLMDTDSIEHTVFRQKNIAELADLLWLWIRSEVWAKKTPQEKIALCKKALSIYQILYENGDYGYANEFVGQIWQHLGDAYLEIGDNDTAIEAVERMAEHKALMDGIGGSAHTSILFDKLIITQDDLSKSFTCTNREIALSWLAQKKYDSIRNDIRFQKLMQKLST